jgi:hypothetical protein
MNVRQNKQLVCDACKRIKQTNVIEDCKCGKGQMWVKSTNTMKTLIEKIKALRTFICSLSFNHWVVIWIVVSCLFWWIYMGTFLLR